MRKPTVAELREREIRNAVCNYNIDIDELRRLMNSYYRYCGLLFRNFRCNNVSESCYNRFKKSIERNEERASKWFDRLNKQFNKYGLEMVFFGITPTICEKGTTRTAIEKYFYNN